MRLILIGFALIFFGQQFVHAEACCHSASVRTLGLHSPHFFAHRKLGPGLRARVESRLDQLDVYSRHFFESEQSIHMPYDSWNIYYYDRPYQFRHHAMLLPALSPSSSALREQMMTTYDQIEQRSAPEYGNVDGLEFAVLPSD